MIKETGRVIAVDDDYVWVETINRGTCGTCDAEKGCGQSLLARWLSRSNYLKVSLNGVSNRKYSVNDTICIGVPENIVVLSSLLIYCLPLFGLIAGATIGQIKFQSDSGAIGCALMGLLIAAILIRLFTWWQRDNRGIRPVIVDLIET